DTGGHRRCRRRIFSRTRSGQASRSSGSAAPAAQGSRFPAPFYGHQRPPCVVFVLMVFMFRLLSELQLERYPRRANDLLQAWDAADELILLELEKRGENIGDVLIVNDSWGALSVALADRR